MIRTVEDYLQSLKDGRVIYCMGERVEDVASHPILRRMVKLGAMDWVLTNDPELRSTFVTKNEEGEETHFLFTSPKTADDLIRRRHTYIEGVRYGGIHLHCMGVDGLAACTALAGRLDRKLGTNYGERVEAYRRYLQKNDLGVTTAQTDVKGDRGLRPSKQVQHKDFYVRVVDKNKDGIIVRGAKMHISSSPMANEAFVVPSRTHAEDDKDYAVAFATPLNAKGITLICSEPSVRVESTPDIHWDYPNAAIGGVGDGECMVVFDDVFVPWERVFLCGEWQFSRDIAYLFATFHRLFACCRMVVTLDELTGVAALMAEYNGLEKYEHVRNKLAWLVSLTEAFKAMSLAACMFPEKEPDSDLVNPNRMYINIAKFMYADGFHDAIKMAQDICGGIAATAPSYKDWANPEERPYLEKYLAGKGDVPTEHRLKAIRLLRDLTGWQHTTHNIQAEGSLEAQKMMFYANADWKYYKAAAKRAARITGWEDHPYFGSLKDFDAYVESKMPPVDRSYKL